MKLSALEKCFGRKPQTVVYPQKWMIVWWLSHTSYLYLNNGYLFYVHTLRAPYWNCLYIRCIMTLLLHMWD